MKAEIEYCADLFRRDRMIGLLKRLILLLERIAEAPETGIDDLPLIDEVERQRVLVGLNQTNFEYDFSRFVDEVILDARNSGLNMKP